jgi:N-acetylglucosaminyl-diphospho-decaprenol L-rhamnosyltransferase
MEDKAANEPMMITVSVVSHGQWHLVSQLLTDLRSHCNSTTIELILTLNIPEVVTLDQADYDFSVRIIRNPQPKGFGANHNAAFAQANGQFFCVINPDIRFTSCPFSNLLACFSDSSVGIAAPLVLSPEGQPEDSARRFPTPWKILGKLKTRHDRPDYSLDGGMVPVDWCAGMLLLFPANVYANLRGFDERYFLYYEDVDICSRLTLSGFKVVMSADTHVVHHAQRSSHRQIRYMFWHVRSILRFFLSPVYRRLRGGGWI